MSAQQKNQQTIGNHPATTGGALPPNSVPPLMDRAAREDLARNAASMLIDLLPPQDVPNPEIFMTGIVAELVKYHQHVIQAAPTAIAARVERLTIKAVRDACLDLQDPISRAIERERGLQALPAPSKPDAVVRDAQVVGWERIKASMDRSMKPIPDAPVDSMQDGNHAARIAADLKARRSRNQQRQQEESTGPPDD